MDLDAMATYVRQLLQRVDVLEKEMARLQSAITVTAEPTAERKPAAEPMSEDVAAAAAEPAPEVAAEPAPEAPATPLPDAEAAPS